MFSDFFFKTAQPPTVWKPGIWDQSEYGIRHGVDRIWIYDNGNTPISGNLDVGPAQATTSVKAYVNHAGYTGYVEMEADGEAKVSYILTLVVQRVYYYLLSKMSYTCMLG